MAYLILKSSQYWYESDVYKVIDYVTDPCKSENMIYGGSNIIGDPMENSNDIARQFCIVQRGRKFSRRVYHLIVTYDDTLDAPTGRLLYETGMAIAGMYPDYQTVFAVHENTDHLHLHMVLNNCAIDHSNKNLTYCFNYERVKDVVNKMIDYHLGILPQ